MYFREFKNVFPSHLIPFNSRLVIYGALDMGMDYIKYINDTGYCLLVAVVDRRFDAIWPKFPIRILPPETVFALEFDYVLIASSNHGQEIIDFLHNGGIEREKIVYTDIRQALAPPSMAARIYEDYFLAKSSGTDVSPEYTSHPIHKRLQSALGIYYSADLFEHAQATLELMQEFTACDALAFRYGYEHENLIYGNAYTLAGYAGLKPGRDYHRYPYVMHMAMPPEPLLYVPLSPLVISINTLTQSNAPAAIPIGPLMAYASSDISEAQFKLKKERLGRTLAVYPPHSHANGEAGRLEDIVEKLICRERGNYDSIIVSLYFYDINQELLNHMSDIGVYAVTAGVRTDQRFLRRQRAIMDLSDDIIVTGIFGTPLFSAVLLGKIVKYIDVGEVDYFDIEASTQIKKNYRDAMKRQLVSGEFLSEAARDTVREALEFDKLRTPEELRAIFEINETILDRTHGDINAFLDSLREYRDELESIDDDTASRLKLGLIQEALRNGQANSEANK